MVVFVSSNKLIRHTHRRLQAKLDHLLHRHDPDTESGLAALRAFRAQLEDGLAGLVHDREKVSFSWTEKGFKMLHGLNLGFERLVEDVDFPMSEWGSTLVDEYLGFTLDLLDVFNSMSSLLARLQRVRLSLAYALSSPSSGLIQDQTVDYRHRCRYHQEGDEGKGGVEKKVESQSGKQGILLEALVEMKGVAFWVCRVIVCGLGGEVKSSTLMDQVLPPPLPPSMVEKGEVLKEVMEVNEMVAMLGSDEHDQSDSSEMEKKVEKFEGKLEEAVKEVNSLFYEVLESRNRLIDCFRLQKE